MRQQDEVMTCIKQENTCITRKRRDWIDSKCHNEQNFLSISSMIWDIWFYLRSEFINSLFFLLLLNPPLDMSNTARCVHQESYGKRWVLKWPLAFSTGQFFIRNWKQKYNNKYLHNVKSWYLQRQVFGIFIKMETFLLT